MHPAKCRRRRKYRHIAFVKTVHCFFVTLEANEPTRPGHIHLVSMLFIQVPVTASNTVLEDVSHSDQLDGAVLDRQSVGCCSRAPTTAADQGNLDGVITGSIDLRNDPCRQSRGRGNPTGGFQKLTTRRAFFSNFTHNGSSPNKWCLIQMLHLFRELLITFGPLSSKPCTLQAFFTSAIGRSETQNQKEKNDKIFKPSQKKLDFIANSQ